VNELCTQFDWASHVRRCDREDAAAYAIAGFEDFDIYAGLMQRTSRAQPGRAGANHDDHETKCTAIDDGL